MVYVIEKKIKTKNTELIKNQFLDRNNIDLLIDHDADVYNEDNKLLLKFRKDILPKENINVFYDNVIRFARNITSNRGNATGNNTKQRNVKNNPKIMSNIFGYYDSWGPAHKLIFKNLNIKAPNPVHETRFLKEHPNKFKKCIPLIKNIDNLYKNLIPKEYNSQKKKANKTYFKIDNTSFTTITTNINYQTSIHIDKGDDLEGFGNLTVIEKGGSYEGSETCFPRYGIGVDVRTGDMLFMDVHEWHGNLPMINKKPDTIRLSLVCYLRTKIYDLTKNMSKKESLKHINYVNSIFEKNKQNKKTEKLNKKNEKLNKKRKTKKRKN